MALTYDEQKAAGMFCQIHPLGEMFYCEAHHCRTTNDRCCTDAQEVVERVIKMRADRMSAERHQRRGYPW